jgi:hypothetical protein
MPNNGFRPVSLRTFPRSRQSTKYKVHSLQGGEGLRLLVRIASQAAKGGEGLPVESL